uniref:Uncharacterized protein n=1 Tax=Oryza brachyantha TaxID=4533 RepID=J3LGN2_ORYBR
MPHPSIADGCRMAIKTYGRHNLWKSIGLARHGRPSVLKLHFVIRSSISVTSS